jgi:lipopolysaccharide export system protein LptA
MTKFTTVALVVIALYAGHNEAADVLRLSDNDTIVVAADESWEDLYQDIIHFRGNVEIQTTAWAVKADRVIIYGKLEDVERIVADGSPLYFMVSRSAAGEDDPVVGEGQQLEYRKSSGKLSLSGNAILSGEGQTIRSSEIHYDLEQQKVEAGGPEGVHITVDNESTG